LYVCVCAIVCISYIIYTTNSISPPHIITLCLILFFKGITVDDVHYKCKFECGGDMKVQWETLSLGSAGGSNPCHLCHCGKEHFGSHHQWLCEFCKEHFPERKSCPHHNMTHSIEVIQQFLNDNFVPIDWDDGSKFHVGGDLDA
jgi:hypothetical protein